MFGLGSYWAWMNLSASNAALFPWLVESVYPVQLIVSSCSYLVTMLLLFVFGTRLGTRRAENAIVGAACCASLGGALFVVAGGTAFAELLVFGQVVVAAGTAVLLVYWGVVLSGYSPSASGVMAAGSFVVGCSLYLLLVVSPVHRYALCALPVLLTVCGGLLLVMRRRDRSRKAPVRGTVGHIPVEAVGIFACLVVCVLLNEVIRIVSTPLIADEFSLVGRLTQSGGLAVACAALLALVWSKKKLSFNAMSRLLLPLMVAGFLSFLVFDGEDTYIMFVMLGAGYWCLQLLIWIALCDAINGLRLSAVRSFALLYGSMQGAILVAKPLGSIISDVLRGVASGLSLIVSAAVLIVVVLAMFLVRDGRADLWRTQKSSPEENRFDAAWLSEIACEFGLSPRETEVFQLLARGRSLPVVTRELSIAKGTAQTHVRHIYEKMDVHTRQELLDLIEGRSADSSGRRAS